MVWKKLSALLIVSAFVLTACGGGGSAKEGSSSEQGAKTEQKSGQQGEQKMQYSSVTLPESTVIEIALLDSVDTDKDVSGATFNAEISSPTMSNGKVIFATGAKVIGKLDQVVESGRLKTPAELTISLVSIEGPDGEMMDVDAYPIHEKKDSHTKREVGMIGGGTIIGGAIGKITGKKGGTEIGMAAGAAAGAAAAAATGKQDIEHPPGTKAAFYLRTPITIRVPA
jgi:hypothetical protein